MNITSMLRAISCPVSLIRERSDILLDRGLALLASRRPTRVVAREDYMLRSYLLGRMGHGFPEGAPATFGNLGGSAYLHCIRTPDNVRAHHSHPWECAVSMVITGGYTEEVVSADGSIVTRQRLPGSIAVINASSFHRISELHARRVWTLFITGARTPDRAWYFRRLDGSIVHERDYHANLEAELIREESWVAAEAGHAEHDTTPDMDTKRRASMPTVIEMGPHVQSEPTSSLVDSAVDGYEFDKRHGHVLIHKRESDGCASYVGTLYDVGTPYDHKIGRRLQRDGLAWSTTEGRALTELEQAPHAAAWAHAQALANNARKKEGQ